MKKKKTKNIRWFSVAHTVYLWFTWNLVAMSGCVYVEIKYENLVKTDQVVLEIATRGLNQQLYGASS